MKSRWSFIVAILIVAILATGCGQNQATQAAPAASASDGQPQQGGIFRLAFQSDIPTLDPAHAGYDLQSWSATISLYSALVDYGTGLDLQPDLAETWSASPDGKVYTFNLRHGVKFTSGRELTAEDVKYSIKRIVDPLTKSEGAWLFNAIQGATEFSEGKASDLEGVKVIDPYTVQITLTEPQVFFPNVLAMPYARIVAKEQVEKYGEEFSHNPLGSGPFKLKEWKPGQLVTLERNKDYFIPGKPYLDEVQYVIGPTEQVAMMSFERGELELSGIPTADFQRITTSPQWKDYVSKSIDASVYYVGMKTQQPPFDNPKVRQAVNYAVDKDRIVKLIGDRGVVANGVIPPPVPGYDPSLVGYPYNPEKAKQLLTDAGFANGFDTQLWSANDDQTVKIVQAIQEDLRKVGINVELHTLEWGPFLEAYPKKDEAPMFFQFWFNDYPDPDDFLHNLLTKDNWGPNNATYYSNPKVDELVGQARVLTDQAQRTKMYQEAEKLIVEDAPWLFLYHSVTYNVYQPYVKNFYLHPVHLWRFSDYWIQK